MVARRKYDVAGDGAFGGLSTTQSEGLSSVKVLPDCLKKWILDGVEVETPPSVCEIPK